MLAEIVLKSGQRFFATLHQVSASGAKLELDRVNGELKAQEKVMLELSPGLLRVNGRRVRVQAQVERVSGTDKTCLELAISRAPDEWKVLLEQLGSAARRG